jgi:hypothetical protein
MSLKLEIARKSGMMIINLSSPNVDALVNVPEFACVSRKLVNREQRDIRNVDEISAIAKEFSGVWNNACTGRVVEPHVPAAAPQKRRPS